MTTDTRKWKGEFDATPDQHALKRRLILLEAGQAFNARGYSDVSLDQVAARLGISKTVCYYYFRDKNDLLMSCAEIGMELYESALAVGESTDGKAIDKLVEFIRAYVR
ncbi:MAG TPA: TetR/AcrR family transcriptional regulator, partial [Quisquiliibacterium sp.]|nr:TetR/AcrR family transcriptional regulator [Quisquiliibacterium sp.]